MPSENILIVNEIENNYRQLVEQKHSNLLFKWPLLSGFSTKKYYYKGWSIFILFNDGPSAIKRIEELGEMKQGLIGFEDITEQNKSTIRRRLEQHFPIGGGGVVLFFSPDGSISSTEYYYMLQKHERYMGIAAMKLFLSHKASDKQLVRGYKETLKELGFDPWLDEDAMCAGESIERAILKGLKESCAAIFFVTPNYKDDGGFISKEIECALEEKRKKSDNFSIVTLVFSSNGEKGNVPDLLRRYVWKEPQDDLEAVREILKAIPIKLGDVYWKSEI